MERNVPKSEGSCKLFLSWDMMEPWVWTVLPDDLQPDPSVLRHFGYAQQNQMMPYYAAATACENGSQRKMYRNDYYGYGGGRGMDENSRPSSNRSSDRSSLDYSNSPASIRSISPALSQMSCYSGDHPNAGCGWGHATSMCSHNNGYQRPFPCTAYPGYVGHQMMPNGGHVANPINYPMGPPPAYCAAPEVPQMYGVPTSRSALPRHPFSRQRCLEKFDHPQVHVNPYAAYAKTVDEPDPSESSPESSASIPPNPYASSAPEQPTRQSTIHYPVNARVSRPITNERAVGLPAKTPAPTVSVFKGPTRNSGGEGATPDRSATVPRNELEMLSRFGETGTGPGQMDSPHGFCIGRDGEIVIADTMNHRIQIFDQKGTLLLTWGNAGFRRTRIWQPRKVAYFEDTGHLIISDRGRDFSRLQVFTREGELVRTIRQVRLSISVGLTVYENKIVAVENLPSACYVIDQEGNMINEFSLESVMREPSAVLVHKDLFYICDFLGHKVCVFDSDGKLLQRIGEKFPGIIFFPNGIDVTECGNLVVADTHGNRFHTSVWNTKGKLLADFELPHMKVSRCCGLIMTKEGNLITAATNNNIVLITNEIEIPENVEDSSDEEQAEPEELCA